MRRSIKQAWLRELRDTRQRQSPEWLAMPDSEGIDGFAYSALGLLAKLAAAVGIVERAEREDGVSIFYDPLTGERRARGLPREVGRWARLHFLEEKTIFDMNKDVSLPRIADVIDECIPAEEDRQ
jgi:hypothetical protein